LQDCYDALNADTVWLRAVLKVHLVKPTATTIADNTTTKEKPLAVLTEFALT